MELLRRAVWLAGLFGVAHAAGLRGCTSAMLQGPSSSYAERFACLMYLFLYGSFIMVVPTLLIAAGLIAGWDKLTQMRTRRPQTERTQQ